MRGSVIVLLYFLAGILAGHTGLIPTAWSQSNASTWALYLLLITAGMGMGVNARSWTVLSDLKAKVLLVPLGVAAGSLVGGAIAGLLLGMSLRDGLAVAAGMGYYSLSSILITQLADASLGSVALLANLVRELTTLLLAPLCARLGGPLGVLAAGGAASMDTCLPMVTRYTGERCGILAVFSGMCLSMMVPMLITALFM